MASTTLYPPIVNNTAAAFIAGDQQYCRLYFSLSKYSSSTEQIKSIHISVIKQSNGQSVVKKIDDSGRGRFRTTGIIIVNTSPTRVIGEDNLYYIDILNDDIQSGDTFGWYPSWIYKIQIRLSTVAYDNSIGQAAWLNINASNFSEWSTYCTTKAIYKPRITIPILDYDSEINNGYNSDTTHSLSLSTLDFSGSYSNEDNSETLYSYNIQLFDIDKKLLEDSGILYTNQYYTPNQFRYIFKTELEDTEDYILRLSYTTVNKYEETLDFDITINEIASLETKINAVTIDTVDNIVDNPEFVEKFKEQTSLELEQEDGRVGIKLYSTNINPFNGNICLRRADSKDNFNTWTDIKIVVCVNTVVNDLDMIFDYTVESGVWYKYGVQIIEPFGNRGVINYQRTNLIREFEYSFLVGENGRQLKLKYNNDMNTYTYNYLESKVDTIGGKYPFITRNGNTEYRTFPINGLISFNMDENELFTNDKELYKYNDVVLAYRRRRREENLGLYDYKLEHDFREKVLEFLQDGKPKLFKSSTEGNSIIRLMQVAAQPNQSLNRMIYSFTSTAHEIAEPTMENYLKFGFYEVGEPSDSFAFSITKLGQLEMNFNIGDNIIEKIWDKYNHSMQNIAGIKQTVDSIHHLELTFTDKPIRVYNNANEEIIGYNIKYNGNKITINGEYNNSYIFDENIIFDKDSTIEVLGGIEDIYKDGILDNTIHIIANFLYDIKQETYNDKVINRATTKKGVGQVYNTFSPGMDIYREIYYKFYYEWDLEFRRLSRLSCTCIEAAPGSVFLIQDGTDDAGSDPKQKYHEINWTGILNLEGFGIIQDIKYIGMRNTDGSIDETKNIDVIVDYLYYISEGTYKEVN